MAKENNHPKYSEPLQENAALRAEAVILKQMLGVGMKVHMPAHLYCLR